MAMMKLHRFDPVSLRDWRTHSPKMCVTPSDLDTCNPIPNTKRLLRWKWLSIFLGTNKPLFFVIGGDNPSQFVD